MYKFLLAGPILSEAILAFYWVMSTREDAWKSIAT